jgi:hypothetical protein
MNMNTKIVGINYSWVNFKNNQNYINSELIKYDYYRKFFNIFTRNISWRVMLSFLLFYVPLILLKWYEKYFVISKYFEYYIMPYYISIFPILIISYFISVLFEKIFVYSYNMYQYKNNKKKFMYSKYIYKKTPHKSKGKDNFIIIKK